MSKAPSLLSLSDKVYVLYQCCLDTFVCINQVLKKFLERDGTEALNSVKDLIKNWCLQLCSANKKYSDDGVGRWLTQVALVWLTIISVTKVNNLQNPSQCLHQCMFTYRYIHIR